MKRILFVLFILPVLVHPAFPREQPILTVLDFDVTNVSESEMRSIINYLSSAIFRTGLFTVIDTG